MAEPALSDYFLALERLKKSKPQNVPKGTKITNDAVALEAGRCKGSIKKSRPVFAILIQAIDDAANEQAKPERQQKDQIEKWKTLADNLRQQLEAAIGREVSLLRELYEAKKKIMSITGERIIPLRGVPPETGKGVLT
jgi:hypothetical protein